MSETTWEKTMVKIMSKILAIVKEQTGITIVITKNDIIKMIESCFQKETLEETLRCLQVTLKLLLVAVENTLEQIMKEKKQ